MKSPKIEDNQRRHSFNDRICDDLCEEILKYLSFADKNPIAMRLSKIFREQYSTNRQRFLLKQGNV